MSDLKDYDHLLERIYAQHLAIVKKLMYKGVEENEAPDLAVKVMLDAAGALHQLRDEDKLEAWLMTIAENSAYRYLKERAKKWEREISTVTNMETGEEIDITATLEDEMTVERILKTAEDRKMLNTVLSCLNEKERTVFIMRNLDGLKFREISEILDINLNTVKSLHSRSCDKLKAYSEKLYGKEAYYD